MHHCSANGIRIAMGFLFVIGPGCAAVDPQPDYERLARTVAAATSQPAIADPDQDADADAVHRLLDDGITAENAVRLCLINNPRLRAAYFEVGIARADVVQSALFSNPSLGLSLRLPDAGGLANFEAGLAQNIADLWQIPFRKRAAEQALEQTILDVARRIGETAIEAKAAYYRAAAADRLREIAAENVSIAGQLSEAALAVQRAGAGSIVEVNAARSELLDAELAMRTAALDAYEARRALAVLLGLTVSPDELKLAEPLPETAGLALDPRAVAAIAMKNRPDLEAAHRATAAALARWHEQRLSVFRNVEVGVALERNERPRSGSGNLLGRTARASLEAGRLAPPGPQTPEPREVNTIIGPVLDIELPVFDQNQARITRAEYAYRQAVRLADSLQRELAQEVRGACERLQTACDAARFFREKLLPLREENLSLARQGYQAGKTSFQSVLEAQRSLLDARRRYVAALEAAAVACTGVEKVAGQTIRQILATAPAATRPSPAAPDATHPGDSQ